MNKVADPTLYWAVLARPRGEVLTAEAESPGLHLGLLGVPPGFGTNAAEGWLYDVIGVAHESSPAPPGSQPIPALLHHALTGLLFSHGELWSGAEGPRPCSFAFAHTVHEVGFGWVGDAQVTVYVDGQVCEPQWVTVRDEAGREAYAWSISANHSVQVMMVWRDGSQGTDAGAEVEAVWSAVTNLERQATPTAPGPMVESQSDANVQPAAAADTYSARLQALQDQLAIELDDEIESVEVVTDYPDAAEPAAERTPAGESAIARWLRRGFSWFTGKKERRAEDPSLEHGSEEQPPSAERFDDVDEVSGDFIEMDPATVDESPPAVRPHDDVRVATATRTAHQGERVPTETSAHAAAPAPAAMARSGEAMVPAPVPLPAPVPAPIPPVVPTTSAAPVPPAPMVRPASVAPAVTPRSVAPVPRPPVVVTTSVAPAARPDLIPPTPEPPTVTRTAAPAPPPAVVIPTPATNIWRRVPESIPPTPEPAEVTGRAAAWAEPTDPHIIDLPAPRPSSTAPGGAPRVEPAKAAVKTRPTPPPPISEEAVVRPAFHRVESGAPEPPPEHAIASGAPGVRPVRARSFSVPQQRPTWPSSQQLARPVSPVWRRPWAWVAAAVALILGGWLVGAFQDAGRSRDASARGALSGALRSIGLGGPRFSVNVNSRPPGAWISVDGKTLAMRTPAAVEVTPGEHTIGLSFPDLGGASYTVRGIKGDRVPLDATLWGALEISSPSKAGVLTVEVDGEARGFAPLRVDSLTPGVHEVRFSGLGMSAWGQTVDIRVGETKEVLARATSSPATGVLQVDATLTDEQGTQPLKGGQVWIDGEPRGLAPLTLDLPRGPHSVRLVYKGQQAPIQLIDLPGGNQRFAVFEFGLDVEPAQLTADVPPRVARDRPTVVSASLSGSGAGEVREMWLHTQTPEGPWRRYPMTLLRASGSIVGVAVFPQNTFDGQDRTRYYLSAQNQQGDESFTEIRAIQLEKPAAR